MRNSGARVPAAAIDKQPREWTGGRRRVAKFAAIGGEFRLEQKRRTVGCKLIEARRWSPNSRLARSETAHYQLPFFPKSSRKSAPPTRQNTRSER
jgi:hypothetical protein